MSRSQPPEKLRYAGLFMGCVGWRVLLRRLRIENLVLIHEADLAFASGLNAVTGETGAGKTIFAQAIGLLLGARTDASSVGSDGTGARSRPSSTFRMASSTTRSWQRSPSFGPRARPGS